MAYCNFHKAFSVHYYFIVHIQYIRRLSISKSWCSKSLYLKKYHFPRQSDSWISFFLFLLLALTYNSVISMVIEIAYPRLSRAVPIFPCSFMSHWNVLSIQITFAVLPVPSQSCTNFMNQVYSDLVQVYSDLVYKQNVVCLCKAWVGKLKKIHLLVGCECLTSASEYVFSNIK